jgi:purine catabolism regulator
VPPSVRTVTELPGLGLTLLAGPDGRDRPVRWVAVSEQEDPTPFLEGGELLLTTGMRLPADQPGLLVDYVDRLVDVGVAALGIGVGLTHATCPPALVQAAAAGGLPLIEVPGGTAFIAISKAVSALLGVEEYEGIHRAFEAQRDLTRAALAPEGAAVVAGRLARHVEGWALVLDGSGRPVHAAPDSSAAETSSAILAGWPAAHKAELAELRRRGLLASSSMADASGQVSLHPLGARGRVRGFLAVGTPRPLDRNGQSVVAVAVSLLSIAIERDGPHSLGGREIRAATLRLLVAGADPNELPLDVLGWGWLVDATLRVVVARGSLAQRAEAVHRLDGLDAPSTATGPDSVPRLCVDGVSGGAGGTGGTGGTVGDELVIVLVDDSRNDLDLVAAELTGLVAGGSSPATVHELGRARTEAVQALAGAHGPGVHWFGQLAADGMLGALDPQAARGVADALLAPLEGRKGDLLASLQAWLARHGQWDTAAADLGVHRHTLRYRMRRVEELLDRSLDDADLRVELWLALRVRGQSGAGTAD